MAHINRQPTLKRTYYRSFLLLVVIPLILVFVCAEVVVSYIIRNSAIETIDAFQQNIATTLSGDIRDNALKLSHFVYTNDGEFIQTAVTVYRSRGSDWYIADQAIQRAFRTAMVPSQDILVGAFYMDRAGAVYMKDDVAIPEGQVREASWYRRAIEQPNRVVLSCYDTSRTRVIPDTDWSVVTFVEESSLGRQFYLVGGILALIVIALMTLFYFYSHYFLNAIITPVQEVCRGMERLDQNDLEVQLEPKGQRELQDLMTSFNQMVLSIKHMLRLTEETVEKKHQAEMQALQSQINPHFIPYLYMPGNKQRTLTTFLMDYANAQQGSWQSLAAGIVIIMLPTIVLYVFFQKYILAGVAAGAVKE